MQCNINIFVKVTPRRFKRESKKVRFECRPTYVMDTIDAGDNIHGSSVAHESSHSTRVKDNCNVEGNMPGENSFMPYIKVNNVQYDAEND